MIYTNEITIRDTGDYVELSLAGNEYIVLREDLINAGTPAGFADAATAAQIGDEKFNRELRDRKSRGKAINLLDEIQRGIITRKSVEFTLQEIIDNMTEQS